MKNNFIKKVLSAALSAVLLLCSLLGLGSCNSATSFDTVNIKIVHTSDIHARVLESDESIGVERLKTIIDSFTLGSDLDLTLDSGDFLHGQSIATLVRGESIAKLAKALGYSAMSAGDHDFNYGKDRLIELGELAELSILAGNVVDAQGERFFEEEFLIKRTRYGKNRVTVGVMGMIDPIAYSSTAPYNVEGLSFTDIEEYAMDASARLREEYGCDIVIALAHIGSPTELAARVDGVDLWLTGHDHNSYFEEVTTPDGSTSYVIESGQYLESVSLIDINVDVNKKGEILRFELGCEKVGYADKEIYSPDEAVGNLLAEITAETDAVLGEVVGRSPLDLDGTRKSIRTSQTALGTAIASAFLLQTGADIAFENAGGIRDSISAGDVTYGDILNVSPYGNTLITKKISGRAIREALEMSLDFRAQTLHAYATTDPFIDPECSGTSLQFAGMVVECDMSAEKGSRVLSVTVGGQLLDDERLYTVAFSDYVGNLSDYTMFNTEPQLGQFGACDEAIIKFFTQTEEQISAAISKDTLILR